jgi:anti-anti-sigma factor
MPSSMLQVKWSDQGTTRVLVATGELDVASTRRLDKEIARAIADRRETVVVDLSELSFCDSSGVRLTLSAQRQAAAQGVRLVVLRPTGPARRVFEICDAAFAAVA